MQRRVESLFRGTVVLAAANLATRLLGVVLWPAVTRIFAPYDGAGGDAGAGLARMPLYAYQIVFSFASIGFNVAIAKLVAERLAVQDTRGARRVFQVSLRIMAALGLGFTAAFWWGAPALAEWVGRPLAAPGFRAMAPAMILMTLTAAYRGLFQGFQFHTPNGISQMLEQTVRVAAALVLLALLVRVSVPLGAAAVNFGDVPGALAALLYLYWLYRQERRSMWRGLAVAPPEAALTETTRDVLRRILAIALPITLNGAVSPLMLLADTVMVNRLLRQSGVAETAVDAAFGQLGNASTLLWASTLVSGALYTALVPAIAEAAARGRHREVRTRVHSAYLVTFLTGLPLVAGTWSLSGPIYRLVFGSAEGGPVLAALAPSALFLMLQQTTSGLLQGAGRVTLTTANLLAGAAIKILMTYVFMGPLGLGIYGAAYATVVGQGAIALLNILGVQRHLGAAPQPAFTVLKPGLASAAMVAALRALGQAWPVPGALLTLLLVAAGAAVYAAVLILVRGLPAEGLGALPGGGRLLALLQRLRLI